LLRHSLGLEKEAQAVEKAVDAAITAGHRTIDLARPGESTLNTAMMTHKIVELI
jgi:3-isopropylmalate dehydrogenase